MIDQATLCQGVEPGTVPVCDATAGSAPADTGAAGTPRRTPGRRHRAGDHGRLTTLTLSVCLRPAPAILAQDAGAVHTAS